MVMRTRIAVRTVTVRCRPEITARGAQVTTRSRGGVVVGLTFLAKVGVGRGVPVALVVGWVTDVVNLRTRPGSTCKVVPPSLLCGSCPLV
jgi:hypothetical protein